MLFLLFPQVEIALNKPLVALSTHCPSLFQINLRYINPLIAIVSPDLSPVMFLDEVEISLQLSKISKLSQVSKIWLFLHAICNISIFCKPLSSSFFTNPFYIFLCTWYLPIILPYGYFENNGSFTSIVSWLMKPTKTQSVAYLCSFLLAFITSWSDLSFWFPGSSESSMQITAGVSRGFHWLDCVTLSHLTKKLQNFWKLLASPFFDLWPGRDFFLVYSHYMMG